MPIVTSRHEVVRFPGQVLDTWCEPAQFACCARCNGRDVPSRLYITVTAGGCSVAGTWVVNFQPGVVCFPHPCVWRTRFDPSPPDNFYFASPFVCGGAAVYCEGNRGALLTVGDPPPTSLLAPFRASCGQMTPIPGFPTGVRVVEFEGTIDVVTWEGSAVITGSVDEFGNVVPCSGTAEVSD
jgi:hypothetical protein